MRFLPVLVALVAGAARAALDVDLSSTDSIKQAAREVAHDLLTYYKGNQSGQIPGILPGPPPNGDYYWWQGGAMWGAMIDYWHFTGDSTYNDLASESLLFQVGPRRDYMPPNWTASLGNDDQAFWAMSAMLAAETNFPNPPRDQPQWLALAQAVFQTQLTAESRDHLCGGGLRWQAILGNTGWSYKNSIANGCFFNLGARLARYTNNDTYAKHAIDTWNWMTSVGLMDGEFNIYDGAHVETNCTDINKQQFSYNAGIFLQGAAFLYDYTKDPVWEPRINGLLNQLIEVFYPEGVAIEIACETEEKLTCTPDMLSFKGFVLRWLATVAQLAPFTKDKIQNLMMGTTKAAIRQCSGTGPPGYGRTCGFRWNRAEYDGTNGAGQQMNVLGALSSLLFPQARGPLTNLTGGTSLGDYNAGGDSGLRPREITVGDKAGAGILTILVLLLVTSTFAWMSTEFFEGKLD